VAYRITILCLFHVQFNYLCGDMSKIFCLFFLILLSLLNACTNIQNDSALLREQVQEDKEKFEKNEFDSEFDSKFNSEKNQQNQINGYVGKNNNSSIDNSTAPRGATGSMAVNKTLAQKREKQKFSAITYTYEFIIEGLEPSDTEKHEATDLDIEQIEILKKEIIDLLRKNSQLEFLKDKPIESTVALERRASNDIANAIEVMEAFGFYSSSARFHIDGEVKPHNVVLYLKPQEQYVIDAIKINYSQNSKIPKSFLDKEKKAGFLYRKRVKSYSFEFPTALPNIQKDDKAITTEITKAVALLIQPFRENGFPRARVISSAYTVDKNSHELSGVVSVNQGFPAYMGRVTVSGNEEVSSEYINALCPWKYGEVWDERKLLDYRDLLQRTGLFQNVDLRFNRDVYRVYRKKMRANQKRKNPESLDPVVLPVLLTVQESTARSFSGGVFYSTDQGPGVNVSWEHRNFFGNGERLNLRLPLSKDETFLVAELKKPAFIFPTQNLIFKGSGGYEKTDAYEKEFIDVAAGLEREIRKNWWIESLFHVDKVLPKNDPDELDYHSFRWVNTVRYDKRDNKQSPNKGFMGLVRFSPLLGYDESSFHSMATEFDGSVYLPLSQNFLLAARLGLGVMPGSNWARIPRSKRFFLGGGGTVRGFSYQELGRHDADGDPLGGLSYTLVNLEARIKITKEMAIVPFIDGGMVYEEISPEWGQDLAWGTGIGLRYNTPVGPVRFDIAIPLTAPNKIGKKSLSDFQLYISIGQAF